jgi:hypothetical protein
MVLFLFSDGIERDTRVLKTSCQLGDSSCHMRSWKFAHQRWEHKSWLFVSIQQDTVLGSPSKKLSDWRVADNVKHGVSGERERKCGQSDGGRRIDKPRSMNLASV